MRRLLLVAALGGSLAACASRPPSQPPDEACLQMLRSRGVAFSEGPQLKGVRTPVTVDGARFTPRLYPRVKRPPQMDCQLALALVEARPVFESLGITQLDYSAAYDYRNRRGSSKLSQHANGLAIDVHVFHSGPREYVVAKSFEKRPGPWRALELGKGGLETCVANPRTPRGRLLRSLACQLRMDNAFRIIITPDDNWDHHDHFHLETTANFAAWLTPPGSLASGPHS
jgi:hypothetical protein